MQQIGQEGNDYHNRLLQRITALENRLLPRIAALENRLQGLGSVDCPAFSSQSKLKRSRTDIRTCRHDGVSDSLGLVQGETVSTLQNLHGEAGGRSGGNQQITPAPLGAQNLYVLYTEPNVQRVHTIASMGAVCEQRCGCGWMFGFSNNHALKFMSDDEVLLHRHCHGCFKRPQMPTKV